ncbi:uncharacterized protein LOC121381785 [Gigantopelta aegis]|uniref:uncharacterized protein LOC121381785 n=1 Tax=Gigantopelta aegis TaxID=1735272 RepID=UPI001B88A14E|nr:uncharacterized protein LOC121381785 [Gigantopelta aegis]
MCYSVLLLLSPSALGCIESCTQQFNLDMQAALMGDTTLAAAMSCAAITKHIQCLQRVEASCTLNTNYQMLHQSTLSAAQQKYNQFCQGVSGMGSVSNCGGQYMVCNEQLNSTFNVAMASFDIQKACISLNNYSSCVENMITLPNCGQLSQQAMRTVAILMSKYGPSCQADTIKEGQTIASCMNRTMQCLDSFKDTFSIAVNASDMPTMCQALGQYTTCIENLRQDTTCSQYVAHALVNIETLRSQHRVACGPGRNQG